MNLREAKAQVEKEHPELKGTGKVQAIKDLREDDATAVRLKEQKAQLRVDETGRKGGLTFKDLCDLVDKGRELGIDPTVVVTGDYWLTNRIEGREGYRSKWLEV